MIESFCNDATTLVLLAANSLSQLVLDAKYPRKLFYQSAALVRAVSGPTRTYAQD